MATLSTGVLLSDLSNILKKYYLGPVQEQLNNEILLTQLFPMDAENLEGDKAVIALHSSRSSGIGARGDGISLPDADKQRYKQLEYDLKYHYARVSVTGPSIAKTKSTAGAFLQALKSELDYIKNDVALDFARQLYGNGDAVVATIGTGATSATQAITSAEPIDKGFLYVGMKIDIGTTSDHITNSNNAVVIQSLVSNGASSQIILTASTTTTTSDSVFRAGNGADGSSTHYEMDAGLQKILATSANSVGNLNAATAGNEVWDNLRTNQAGAISLAGLMQTWNRVAQAGGKPSEFVTITTPGITRRLFATSDFTSNVRFVDTQTLKGGFESISFNTGPGSITLVTDRLAPWGKVFFAHKKHFRLFSPADWDFLNRDGLTIRWVPDYDAFQAVLYRYANMGTDRRNSSSVMYAVTDTDGT